MRGKYRVANMKAKEMPMGGHPALVFWLQVTEIQLGIV